MNSLSFDLATDLEFLELFNLSDEEETAEPTTEEVTTGMVIHSM